MLRTTSSSLRSRPSSALLCPRNHRPLPYLYRSYTTRTLPPTPDDQNGSKKPDDDDASIPSQTVNSSSSSEATQESEARQQLSSIESSFSTASTPQSQSLESSPNVATNQLDGLKDSLRTWAENMTVLIRKRADQYTVGAAHTFAQLGKELNKATGYGEIDLLKKRVVEQEEKINAARQAAKRAKEEYDKAVHQRANSQREVNDLLQRKSHWTDDDVGRFTALVRKDHLFEQAETKAKLHATQTEEEVEKEFTELMRVILNRYHEEQVWSDKIRSASTYGSLTVLGLNLLVFLLATVFVEPWKRRRLAHTFEKKVEDMSTEIRAEYESKTAELEGHLKAQGEVLAHLAETAYYSTQPAAGSLTENPQLEGEEEEVSDEITPSDVGPLERIQSSWTKDMSWVVAVSATTAGVVGWVARSLYGRS